jgi:hypothetical protein
MAKTKILEDKFGNPYILLDKTARSIFPDNITLTVDGQEYHFFLEPRVYFPKVGDGVVVNELIAIKYLTASNMADHLDDLIDRE